MTATLAGLQAVVANFGKKASFSITYRVNPTDNTKVDAFAVTQTDPAFGVIGGTLRTDFVNNQLVSVADFVAAFPDAIRVLEV
jgi:hypothetical protein